MLQYNKKEKVQIPTMPLLSAYGDLLFLSAIREDGDKNLLLEKLLLGSTATIIGTFQIVKALDVLAKWGDTKYRDWFFKNPMGIMGK